MTLISFHTKTNFSNSITIKLGKIAYHGEEDLGGTGNKGKVDGALPLYTYTHTHSPRLVIILSINFPYVSC